jgi:hypothetical protein
MNKISSQALHVNLMHISPLKGGGPSLNITPCEVSGAAGESGMGETREMAPSEAVACRIVHVLKVKSKILVQKRSLHGFSGQSSRRGLPPRGRPSIWIEFIKKVPREMSGLGI